MKKRISYFITSISLFLFSFSVFSQIPITGWTTLDDFSDGNFNINPKWTPFGIEDWAVEGGVLSRFSSVAISSNSGTWSISTPFSKPSNAWQFDLITDGGFDGQILDYYFFMTNANPNPADARANGYRVRYELFNTSYRISLQRVSNNGDGRVSSTIAARVVNNASYPAPKITVVRSGNIWELFINSASAGTGTDATYGINDCAYQGAILFIPLTDVSYKHGFDNIRYREIPIGAFATAPALKTCLQDGYFSTTGEGVDRISNINFNDTSFGTYVRNSGELILRGAEIKTFKNPAVSNVCTPVLNYRIFSEGSTPGKFDTMNIRFNSDCFADFFPTGGPCTTGQQKWQTINQNIDLTVYPPGNYTLQLFYKIPGGISSTTSCSDTLFVDNGGSYYSASFSIIEPLISAVNPTACIEKNGSITIKGLAANTQYILTYQKNSTITNPLNLISNSNGEIIISGLDAGTYNAFFLSAECGININRSVTLINPPLNVNATTTSNTLCNSVLPGGDTCFSLGTGVVINEVMAQPLNNCGTSGTGSCQGINSGEYIELYNQGCTPVDLSCHFIGTASSSSPVNSNFAIIIPPGTILPPKSHYVIGGGFASSNPADVDLFVSGLSVPGLICSPNVRPLLTNGDGWVALYKPNGDPVDAIYWTASENQASKINNDDDLGGRPCLPSNAGCANSETILQSAVEIYALNPALITYVGATNITNPTNGQPNGKTFSRIPDGGAWQRDVDPSIIGNNCNGGVCDLNVPINPGNCNGTATVILPDNPSNYSFVWKSGSGNVVGNTQTISNICAGIYTVRVTNKVAGCANETTVVVSDNISQVTPTFNSNLFSPVCQGAILTNVVLPVVSNNGIAGTWNPASLSSEVVGDISYTFTPETGQCADPVIFVLKVIQRPNLSVRADTTINHNSVYPGDIFRGLPPGSIVSWTNSNSSIGLPSSGSGNIPAFTAFNLGGTPITATITVTTNNNCDGTQRSFKITVRPAVITSLINERVLQNFIKVYPNPARDVLQINYGAVTSSKGEIRLLDMQGRVVYSKAVGIAAGDNRYDINLNGSGISAGSYVLKLQSGNAEQQVKVVVVR